MSGPKRGIVVVRGEYEKAKHDYHVKGERARGKKGGSKEQREYEIAKRLYHRLGGELRKLEDE